MNRVSTLLFTAGLLTSGIALGNDIGSCAPRAIHREISPDASPKDIAVARRTSVTLSPTWEDSQILAAFGITNAVAERDKVHAVDGRQVRYRAGKSKVMIVRSYSAGLVITVRNGRFAGTWLMERCGQNFLSTIGAENSRS